MISNRKNKTENQTDAFLPCSTTLYHVVAPLEQLRFFRLLRLRAKQEATVFASRSVQLLLPVVTAGPWRVNVAPREGSEEGKRD